MKFGKPYEAILNCMNEAVYFIDQDMNILYSNPAAEVLTGFLIAEAQGAKCNDIFCETSLRCKDLCPAKVAMREKKPILHREAETKTKSGEVKNTEISFSPFYEGVECVGSVIVIKDITEIKRAKEALDQKTLEQNVILENALVGIAFLKDRRFVWINSQMEQMFGYRMSEIRGLTTELFYPSQESYEQLGSEAYPVLAGWHLLLRTQDEAEGRLFVLVQSFRKGH